jgi:hypothetical protein
VASPFQKGLASINPELPIVESLSIAKGFSSGQLGVKCLNRQNIICHILPQRAKKNINGKTLQLPVSRYLSDDAKGNQQQGQEEKEVVVGEIGEIEDHHQHHTYIYKRYTNHGTHTRP